MSSHREAPQISKDPVADSTDVYAFVSPDSPDTVTLISNYIPLQGPDGGPNFYEFGDDVLYEINVDNNGDGIADVIYQFQFTTTLRDPSYFLYNVGPITSLGSPNWNRVQTYSLQRVDMPEGRVTVLGRICRAHPATSGRSPRQTTRLSPVRPSAAWVTGCFPLPVNGPKGSTSISGRFSTSETCGLSRETTPDGLGRDCPPWQPV